MNDFIPKNILELAAKYDAQIDVIAAPATSENAKYLHYATISLTKNGMSVELRLVYNEKAMRGYGCMYVKYGKWYYNEDDYESSQILRVVEGIFENRTVM